MQMAVQPTKPPPNPHQSEDYCGVTKRVQH